MDTHKLIAFDLGGVLLFQKDFVLTEEEKLLFNLMYNRIKTTNVEELEKLCIKLNVQIDKYLKYLNGMSLNDVLLSNVASEEELNRIILKAHELNDPNIFVNILQEYPKMDFAVATNNIDRINVVLDQEGIKEYLSRRFISSQMGLNKSNPDFFRRVVSDTTRIPSEILFVDDAKPILEVAESVGLITLHYDLNVHGRENFSSHMLNGMKK